MWRRGIHVLYWWESQKVRDHWEYQDVGGWTILSGILVTETGFGLVIGFINRVTVRNYKQLLITLSVVTQFTIIFY
jgi:hypothetical protein